MTKELYAPKLPTSAELHDIMVAWYLRPGVYPACEMKSLWACARKVCGYTPLDMPEYYGTGFTRYARLSCAGCMKPFSICFTKIDFPVQDLHELSSSP